jgi:hypothetical protein
VRTSSVVWSAGTNMTTFALVTVNSYVIIIATYYRVEFKGYF